MRTIIQNVYITLSTYVQIDSIENVYYMVLNCNCGCVALQENVKKYGHCSLLQNYIVITEWSIITILWSILRLQTIIWNHGLIYRIQSICLAPHRARWVKPFLFLVSWIKSLSLMWRNIRKVWHLVHRVSFQIYSHIMNRRYF